MRLFIMSKKEKTISNVRIMASFADNCILLITPFGISANALSPAINNCMDFCSGNINSGGLPNRKLIISDKGINNNKIPESGMAKILENKYRRGN